MQNALPVLTLAGMPADVQAKTVRKTLPNLEAEAVGNTLLVQAIRSGGQNDCGHTKLCAGQICRLT